MKVTHIRRCHVCGTVNESVNSAVQKCSQCKKYLAPFYFFEEHKLDGIGDVSLHLSTWKESSHYQPLWGLSHYWEDE